MCALLAIAVSYDNRKPSDAHIAAWREASIRGRWTYPEAREAILDHFANSTDYLTPGHVTQRLRAKRQQPPAFKQLPAPAAVPASPERIREIVRALAESLGWRQRSHPDSPALTVSCPHCRAAPGRPCARQLGRGHRRGQWVPISALHPSRVDLIRAQEGQE